MLKKTTKNLNNKVTLLGAVKSGLKQNYIFQPWEVDCNHSINCSNGIGLAIW